MNGGDFVVSFILAENFVVIWEKINRGSISFALIA
jgi:hypothetical protein